MKEVVTTDYDTMNLISYCSQEEMWLTTSRN